jgi:hypothetical protein
VPGGPGDAIAGPDQNNVEPARRASAIIWSSAGRLGLVPLILSVNSATTS